MILLLHDISIIASRYDPRLSPNVAHSLLTPTSLVMRTKSSPFREVYPSASLQRAPDGKGQYHRAYKHECINLLMLQSPVRGRPLLHRHTLQSICNHTRMGMTFLEY